MHVLFVVLPFYYSTDPFLKKEWYDIKAPGYFKTRKVGKTLITRTTGTSKSSSFPSSIMCCYSTFPPLFLLITEIASEGLKGRVFEVNLAELQGGDEEQVGFD